MRQIRDAVYEIKAPGVSFRKQTHNMALNNIIYCTNKFRTTPFISCTE